MIFFKNVVDGYMKNQFPPTFNTRNIALILKGQKQRPMKDCRLIGLCNVLYELASKVLANKLKRVLHKCISNNQHTFFWEDQS
jgi:hypothetical protein